METPPGATITPEGARRGNTPVSLTTSLYLEMGNEMAIDWTKPIRRSGKMVPCRYVGHIDNCLSRGINCNHIVAYGFPGHEEWIWCRLDGKNADGIQVIENIPEPPKYRPYNVDELTALIGKVFRRKKPMTTVCLMCIGNHSGSVCFYDGSRDPHKLLEDWEHLDGTPCGVREEEK